MTDPGIFGGGDWRERLQKIVRTMREVSRISDPQQLVRRYTLRMAELVPTSRFLSLSRRDLEPPRYRVARSSTWKEEINPWTDRHDLPVLQGGLLGELVYCNEPRIIDELDIAAADPAAEYFEGQRSLISIPVYDQGVALNVVVQMRERPAAFDREQFPQIVWMANLFGRATHNLVLSEDVRKAHRELDRELAVVGDIQRSLLPPELPRIPRLDLAVSYRTSQKAGGDYYDIFPLADGLWGLLVADVSGHGTPAAVLMAITHAIAHLYSGPPNPAAMLEFLSRNLAARYTRGSGTFVSAFCGVYDPPTRELRYALAGHPPPRLKHCDDGTLTVLEGEPLPPLGIFAETGYRNASEPLRPADQLIFYTDGITEARNADGDFFGTERLDELLNNCHLDADGLIRTVLEELERFTGGRAPEDDTTLLVARVS
ncbi:MAG: PP2C family protein-serine/threonine phosphatase [Planctomycetota bacterium]